MKNKIFSSPVIFARADCTIADALDLMVKHRVGALLVVNEHKLEELVGIFTERDLLYKLNQIQSGNHWLKPIRTVMTKNVITLDAANLSEAPHLMVSQNIRHIPITVKSNSNPPSKKVVGIVSIRDVLKEIITRLDQSTDKSKLFKSDHLKDIKIDLITSDLDLEHFIQQTLNFFFSAKIQSIDPIKNIPHSSDILLIDLDNIPETVWAKVTQSKLHESETKLIVLLFEPLLQTDHINKILNEIGESEKFLVLTKPIDLIRLYSRLSSIYEK